MDIWVKSSSGKESTKQKGREVDHVSGISWVNWEIVAGKEYASKQEL